MLKPAHLDALGVVGHVLVERVRPVAGVADVHRQVRVARRAGDGCAYIESSVWQSIPVSAPLAAWCAVRDCAQSCLLVMGIPDQYMSKDNNATTHYNKTTMLPRWPPGGQARQGDERAAGSRKALTEWVPLHDGERRHIDEHVHARPAPEGNHQSGLHHQLTSQQKQRRLT